MRNNSTIAKLVENEIMDARITKVECVAYDNVTAIHIIANNNKAYKLIVSEIRDGVKQ